MGGWESEREGSPRGACPQKTFGGDEYVLYFDCGDNFMSLYIGKNLPNSVL